jgi:hypothetical protein
MKQAGHRTSEGMVGLRNLAVVALPMVAMCDSRDLGGVVDSKNLGRSAVILYDRYPGGLGYCEKGFEHMEQAGTPVRSVGDGVVVYSGWRNGYGNTIEVRHPNGFVTRYGHLRAFARGVRSGTRVTISQTVGYVGMTGLATGPHLHFEVLVNGVQRDPRKALAARSAEPIPEADRIAFEAVRAQLVATMDAGTTTDVRTLAMR